MTLATLLKSNTPPSESLDGARIKSFRFPILTCLENLSTSSAFTLFNKWTKDKPVHQDTSTTASNRIAMATPAGTNLLVQFYGAGTDGQEFEVRGWRSMTKVVDGATKVFWTNVLPWFGTVTLGTKTGEAGELLADSVRLVKAVAKTAGLSSAEVSDDPGAAIQVDHFGCKKNSIPNWSLNQLRHNAATMLRREFGMDVAKVVLGHSDIKTTEIYAEADVIRARKAIEKVG